MAVTQNTYTGNGSSVSYSFTFPYIDSADIKVSLDGTITTAYTLANATTIQFNTAPANGVAIRIYRQTDDSSLAATFYPGSAIRSQDLNDNFTQNLYGTQEANREAAAAVTTSNSATTTSNTALTTAQSAQADATTAVSTANSASSTAASAVSTANAASSTASTALSNANTANTNASNALSAVSSALLYVPVADVASIPGSPTNGQAVRVVDSTGIESFTPLSGVPGGFVGNSYLGAEIYYQTSASSWVWSRYTPNDPESRYGLATDVAQAQTDILALDSAKLDISTAASTYQTQAGMSSYVATADIGSTVQAYDATILKSADIGSTVQSYDADTVKSDVLPTFTVATRTTERTITASAFDLETGNLWTVGAITVPNPTNAVAGQTGAIRITAGPTSWDTNFKFPGGGGAPTIATFPAIIPYYVQDSSTILMGNVVEGIT